MEIISVLGLAFLGSVLGLIGGVSLLFVKRWVRIIECYAIPFAAGVLLTVSLTGILPETVEIFGKKAFLFALIAFLISYLFENFFFALHHHDDHSHGKNYQASVLLVIIGDTIHNFIDGVAIAAAYLVAPGLGLVTAISTFLHEVPHEISDFGILLKAGWTKGRIIGVNFISACATFVGAILVLFASPNKNVVGLLLAFSGGLFLYLAASDFLPLAHTENKAKQVNTIFALLAGVLLMTLVINLVPHE